MNLNEISSKWKALKDEGKAGRIRDDARTLGVSELELVLTQEGGPAHLLNVSPQELLQKVPSFGHVMALTRNDLCVHERKGTYENIEVTPHVMLAVGEDIDLRLFPRAWNYAVAVENESPRGTLRSIQVFDTAGTAVHKIYLTDTSDEAAWHSFVKAAAMQTDFSDMTIDRTGKPDAPAGTVDADALRKEWSELKDTHDFFPMLKKLGISRIEAVRNAGPEWSAPIKREAVEFMLNEVSKTDMDIMCFVGNDGSIQIHTGKAKKIVRTGPWINVMDPLWNLHLRLDDVHEVFCVRKPTIDGDVHSIELFDDKGGMVAQFFGKRKPGIPELESWRALWRQIREEYGA